MPDKIDRQTEPIAQANNTLGIGDLSTQPSSVQDSADAKLPIEFGRYRLLKQLGEGGMGVVYLAHDIELDRKVALKLPHFSGAKSKDLAERFRREARLAATLDHPNICRIYDIGEHKGRLFLTMAFVEGRSLHEIIRAKGPIEPRAAVTLLKRIATAVQFAHVQGIIHRDLKPANIMIKKDRDFVIMDFGLARRVDQEEAQLTATGAVLGTPAYMAPEQLRGEKGASGPQSDVYSLGIILYELLTGQRPFQGTLPQVYAQVLTTDSVSPSRVLAGIAPALDSICQTATNKNAGQRYQSAEEFASAMGHCLSLAKLSDGTVLVSDRLQHPKFGLETQTRAWLTLCRKPTTLIAVGGAAFFVVLMGMMVLLPTIGKGPTREKSFSDRAAGAEPKFPPSSRDLLLRSMGSISQPETAEESQQVTDTSATSSTASLKGRLNVDLSQSARRNRVAPTVTHLHEFAAWILENDGSVSLLDGKEIYHVNEIPETLTGLSKVNLNGVQDLPDEFRDSMPSAGIEYLRESECSAQVLAAVFNANLSTLNRIHFHRPISDEHLKLLNGSDRITEFIFGTVTGPSSLGWAELAKFPNLRKLKFYDASVNNLDFLNELPQLETLVLWGLAISDEDLRNVAALRHLRHLNLGLNSQLTDAALGHLTDLKKLNWLSLYKTSVGNPGLDSIAMLASLTHLSLGGTQISDTGLSKLLPLKELKSLAVDSTSITNASAIHMRHPTIEFVNVERTGITDQFLTDIVSNLPRLRKLSVRGTKVRTTAIEESRRSHPNVLIYRGHQLTLGNIGEVDLPADQLGGNLLKPTNLVESWKFNTRVKSAIESKSGAIVFHTSEAGKTGWDVQAVQVGLPLEEWREYILRFKIMSPQKVKIDLVVKIDMGDYHDVGVRETIQTDNTFQDIRLRFVATNVMENANHVAVDMGLEIGKVYLKDMTLTPVAKSQSD